MSIKVGDKVRVYGPKISGTVRVIEGTAAYLEHTADSLTYSPFGWWSIKHLIPLNDTHAFKPGDCVRVKRMEGLAIEVTSVRGFVFDRDYTFVENRDGKCWIRDAERNEFGVPDYALIPPKEDKPVSLKEQLLKLADDCFNQGAFTGRSYRDIGNDLRCIAEGIEEDKPVFKEGDKVRHKKWGWTGVLTKFIPKTGRWEIRPFDALPGEDGVDTEGLELIPTPPKTETPIMVCLTCGRNFPRGCPCGCKRNAPAPPKTEELTMRVNGIHESENGVYVTLSTDNDSHLTHVKPLEEVRSIHIGDEYTVTIQRKG